jgi:hypothetical protein
VRSFCLSREVLFAARPSILPHPGDCVHGRPGEHASEAPSVEILHRETGYKVFGEHLGAIARLHSSSSSPICVLFIGLGDINPSPWATTMVELLRFPDLLDVLAYLHVVKLTSVYLLLTLVVKLTQKLLIIGLS